MIHFDFTQSYSDSKQSGLLLSEESGFSSLTNYAQQLSFLKSPLVKRIVNELNRKQGVAMLQSSTIEGAVLVASGERSNVYQNFATPNYGKPHRDFFYQQFYLAYELAFNHAALKSLYITHLTGGGAMPHYNTVLKTAIEALIHFKHEANKESVSVTFGGCCFKKSHIEGLDDFQKQIVKDGHRKIKTELKQLRDEKLGTKLTSLYVKS